MGLNYHRGAGPDRKEMIALVRKSAARGADFLDRRGSASHRRRIPEGVRIRPLPGHALAYPASRDVTIAVLAVSLELDIRNFSNISFGRGFENRNPCTS